uniref:Nuclear receptor domain-containing protein n=1 Tax=Panagrolaimus superbus TaxID=310955 RepID=A0A914Z2U2_9BILA
MLRYFLTQIEVIPCKVCGDKSSGVHYNVITCESCKSFFNYWNIFSAEEKQCFYEGNCPINLKTRKECTFCRLKKCKDLGMHISKNDEKVDNEVKMYRQLAEVQTYQQPQHNDYSQYEVYPAQSSTTTSIPTFAPQSNGIHISSGNTSQYAPPQLHHPLAGAAPIIWPTPQSSLGGVTAANISNGHNGYALSQAGAAVPCSSGGYPDSLLSQHIIPNADDGFISTILNSYEQNFVKQLFERVDDGNALPGMFMDLSRNDAWLTFTDKLTKIMYNIVEFAKSVPTFAELQEENQINQLKRNTFDMCIVIMSCGYNGEQDTLNIDGVYVPVRQTLQTWPQESNETALALDIVQCFQNLTAFHLTQVEISLFLVIILMQGEEQQVIFTHKLQTNLHNNLMHRYGNETVFARLMEMLPGFREISDNHLRCLNDFRVETQTAAFVNGMPRVKLPDLYVELFSLDQP